MIITTLGRKHVRPSAIAAHNVFVSINDIGAEPPEALRTVPENRLLVLRFEDVEGPSLGVSPEEVEEIGPQRDHINQLIGFAQRHEDAQHVLIHCGQGLSRSPAAAMIWLAVNRPGDRWLLDPSARPNTRMLKLADEIRGSKDVEKALESLNRRRLENV